MAEGVVMNVAIRAAEKGPVARVRSAVFKILAIPFYAIAVAGGVVVGLVGIVSVGVWTAVSLLGCIVFALGAAIPVLSALLAAWLTEESE